MLYPLSYEGGRWRKGGVKPLVVMATAQRSGEARFVRVVLNRLVWLETALILGGMG